MSPDNLTTDAHGQPVDSKGTTLIYQAESLEAAEALLHGDPFWSSNEVVNPVLESVELKLMMISSGIANKPRLSL